MSASTNTSVLRRYHIIDLDDLRRAGKRTSDYQGPMGNVIRPDFCRTGTELVQSGPRSVVAGPP